MKHIERILKTSGIISVSPSDLLSTALGHLASSHDAAFAFDEDKKLLGIINPYHALIRSLRPGKSKVEHNLFHPPHLSPTDPLDRIVRLMMESKIHYLPVFDEKELFLGITSARRIMKIIQSMPQAALQISQILEKRRTGLVTVTMDDTVGKAVELFKLHKFSKLVVIDANMKLKGVLSYYDLIPYLIAPGISKKGGGRGRGASGDKEKFNSTKVRNYAKTTTLTLSPNQTMADAIEHILSRGIGSVVIIDAESHPVGIITTRDILKLLLPTTHSKPVTVVKKHIQQIHQALLNDLMTHTQTYIDHYEEYQSARVVFEEEKDGKLFKIKIEIKVDGQDMKVFEIENKNCAFAVTHLKKLMRVRK